MGREMGIIKSGFDVDGNSSLPPESTSPELLSPSPSKRMRTEHPSTSPTSEAVVDKALVGEEESTLEIPCERRAEQERIRYRDLDLRVGTWGLRDGTKHFPKLGRKCDICGGEHLACVCPYLDDLPRGVERHLNLDGYIIICDCGRTIVDDCCPGGYCVSWRPRRLLEKKVRNKVDLETP